MNHYLATYIDFIQSIGILSIIIILTFSIKLMNKKSNKIIIKSNIRVEK